MCIYGVLVRKGLYHDDTPPLTQFESDTDTDIDTDTDTDTDTVYCIHSEEALEIIQEKLFFRLTHPHQSHVREVEHVRTYHNL